MKKLFVLTMYAVAVVTSMKAGNVCTVYGAENIPVLTEAPNDGDTLTAPNPNDGDAPLAIAPSPVIDCTTVEEAEDLAGFTINVPKKIKSYGKRHISVINNRVIQIIYGSNKKSLCIRKIAEESDFVSDSIQYEEIKKVKIKGLQVTMYGKNGKINSVIWAKDGFFYSINTKTSLSRTKMKKIIKTVVNTDINHQDINQNIKDNQDIDKNTKDDQNNNVQISNPFIDCKTLEEAANLTGFTLNAPKVINEYELDNISVMDYNMIEVIYRNGESRLSIRKAFGSEDISGDWNEYEEIKTIEVKDVQVTTRGANGSVGSAIWTDEKFTYSIFANSAINSEEVTSIVQMIMQ